MAIQELNAEQIRTWSLEEKDRWWLQNVFRGDLPQLTLRSAGTGMGLGAGILIGIVLELWRMLSHNRFPLSPVAMGLAFIVPFHMTLVVFTGGLAFLMTEKIFYRRESRMNEVVIQNQEPICAGLLAGGALVGILVQVADLFLPAAG